MGLWRAVVVAVLVVALIVTLVIGIDYTMQRWEEEGLMPKRAERPAVQMPLNVAVLVGYAVTAIIAGTVAAVSIVVYLNRTRLLGIIKTGDFVRHVLVFGPTGSGKTSLAKRAIELAIRRGSRAVVIDWKGPHA